MTFDDQEDTEWKDLARDPQYATGLWWLIPVVLAVFLVWWFVWGN